MSIVKELCKKKLLSSHLKHDTITSIHRNCLALQVFAWSLREKAIVKPRESVEKVQKSLLKASDAIGAITDYSITSCPSLLNVFLALRRSLELSALEFGSTLSLDRLFRLPEGQSKLAGLAKLTAIDRVDVGLQIAQVGNKKSVKELILSHQMQVKAMFLKSRPKLILSKVLNDHSHSHGLFANSNLGALSAGDYLNNPGGSRSELLSRANSSLDLSLQRVGSRERSRPNVSIFKRSSSNNKELSTVIKM